MVDEAEIAELYERYGHSLYRRCFQLVGSEEDARELLQEVFYQFWRGRKKFERRSSPFTFLYRIATNLSIDKLRRRKTAGYHYEFDESRDGVAPGSGPGANTDALSELAALTEGLDEETLTVAVLSHVDGLTQEEIAATLGLSRRTIGKRLKKFTSHTENRKRLVERQRETMRKSDEELA